MKYELTPAMLNNLMVFLKKTPLIGEEVPAYVEIINVLNKPIQENQETQSKNK